MPLLFAIPLTVCISLFVGRYLGPLGWMDQPGGRRSHASPVPRTGGMALSLMVLIGLVLGHSQGIFDPREWMLLMGICLLGVLDDRLELRARWKAVAGLMLAMGVAWGGVKTFMGGVPLSLFGVVLPAFWLLYFMLLTAAFWAIPQGVNLIDGANGLAIGYAASVLGVLWLAGNPQPYLLGILLGLLLLNWPKAYHFLGDCGSLSLGLALPLLAFNTFGAQSPTAFCWLFAYPGIDVLMVVLIRTLHRRPLGEGDRNHMHHQLQDRLGLPRYAVAPVLWVLGGGSAYGAVATGYGALFAFVCLAVLVVMAASFVAFRWERKVKTEEEMETAREGQGLNGVRAGV